VLNKTISMMNNLQRKTDFKFDEKLERDYVLYGSSQDRNYLSVAYVVFVLFYALFAISDYYLVPQWFSLFCAIRFVFVIPVFLFTLYILHQPKYVHMKHNIVLLSYVVGGLGIALMLILDPMNITYYGGLFLVFSAAYYMLNLKAESALLGGCLILLVLVGGWLLSSNFNLTSFFFLIFYVAHNILGFIGAYEIEKYRRHEFLRIRDLNVSQSALNQMVHEKSEELSQAQISTIFALAHLAESRDKMTGEHVERVSALCAKLADALPLTYFESTEYKQEFVKAIHLASVLHDIGKISISDVILNKPGKLTHDEYEIMKTHVFIGSATLSKLYEAYPNNQFISLGIEITQCHHEKWDGTGYPRQLKGKEIPLSARIMAIADVYDALISRRPYKEAFPHKLALEIITNDTGTHFDPDLVPYFINLFEIK